MKFTQSWRLRALGGEWFEAHVPGNIQYDYALAHDFGDIHYGMNHRKFLEIEDWEWEYQTKLSYTAAPGERVWFVTHGIDYFYDVAVNGEILLRHEGMFTVTEIDITDRLRGGDTLSVFVHKHPKAPGKPASRDQAVGSVKPAVSYTWDYHPRILPSGIWDETYIETRPARPLGEVYLSYTLTPDYARADVHAEIEGEGEYRITLRDREGSTVYDGTERDFSIENPHLWWCSGQGDPYLYTWTVEGEGGCRSGEIGLRTVELVMNEGAWREPAGFPKSRNAAPITICLNGRRIFAKGSNWVLPEMFPGNMTEARYEQHLRLVRDAHMNILRCHGGSGINKDVFYRLCDRMGIMVLQEFPLACNNYTATPAYLRVLDQEARAIIRRLRSHVSLTIWCGGNELFNAWSGMTEQSLALRLLDKLCYELSPERPFMMTSPLNGIGHGGYTFWDDSMACDCFAQFQHSHCTAYNEFGVPGVHSAEYLRSIIPTEVLYPPRPEENWIAHHAYDAWSGNRDRWLCSDIVRRYWQDTNLEELVCGTQWLQSEGYKAIFEEARRQWPHCSMAMNWCFGEPWKTAANNSLVSYPCEPKKGYYAVVQSLRGVLFSARIPKFDWHAGEVFAAQIWLLNDTPQAADGHVEVSADLNGTEYPLAAWDAHAEVNRNAQGPEIRFTLPEAENGTLTLRLRGGTYSSEYRLVYYASDARKVAPTIPEA